MAFFGGMEIRIDAEMQAEFTLFKPSGGQMGHAGGHGHLGEAEEVTIKPARRFLPAGGEGDLQVVEAMDGGMTHTQAV